MLIIHNMYVYIYILYTHLREKERERETERENKRNKARHKECKYTGHHQLSIACTVSDSPTCSKTKNPTIEAGWHGIASKQTDIQPMRTHQSASPHHQIALQVLQAATSNQPVSTICYDLPLLYYKFKIFTGCFHLLSLFLAMCKVLIRRTLLEAFRTLSVQVPAPSAVWTTLNVACCKILQVSPLSQSMVPHKGKWIWIEPQSASKTVAKGSSCVSVKWNEPNGHDSVEECKPIAGMSLRTVHLSSNEFHMHTAHCTLTNSGTLRILFNSTWVKHAQGWRAQQKVVDTPRMKVLRLLRLLGLLRGGRKEWNTEADGTNWERRERCKQKKNKFEFHMKLQHESNIDILRIGHSQLGIP